MLDQNTDRMWYVIGAVLIGAAIIFGMNTLMPNAFASVGDNMFDLIDIINIPNSNMIRDSKLRYIPRYYHLEPSGHLDEKPQYTTIEDSELGRVVRVDTYHGNQGLFYKGWTHLDSPVQAGEKYKMEVIVRADTPTQIGIAIDGSHLDNGVIHTITNDWTTITLERVSDGVNTRPRLYTVEAGSYYIAEMSMYHINEGSD